ncbi:hypothetical protein HK104_001653 [Borealophlyctis nickersoniae]|nr:hypothetical protein HK104_001653 [Borealophlyctis nickersoniae]
MTPVLSYIDTLIASFSPASSDHCQHPAEEAAHRVVDEGWIRVETESDEVEEEEEELCDEVRKSVPMKRQYRRDDGGRVESREKAEEGGEEAGDASTEEVGNCKKVSRVRDSGVDVDDGVSVDPTTQHPSSTPYTIPPFYTKKPKRGSNETTLDRAFEIRMASHPHMSF